VDFYLQEIEYRRTYLTLANERLSELVKNSSDIHFF